MNATEIVGALSSPEVPDNTSRLTQLAQDPISFGSCGELYLASCGGGEVAVKTFRVFLARGTVSEHLLQAASDELLVWRRLRHRNILLLLGVACFLGQPALVTPLVRFGNLADFRREHSFDWLGMCTQVADAVTYLHDNGIPHGDIRAENVLVSAHGQVKLTGFTPMLWQLASHYTNGTDYATLFLRWMAPEILQGFTRKSPAGDVYALGLTILEIITGQVPFSEWSDQEILNIIIIRRATPTRPQALNSDNRFWALLIRCWDRNPSSRPLAADVYEELRAMLQ
ncbi:unnamed protein product [Rhizoctonia solani]|uniref:Protein kinase domain-containing protein n=1 Tax=Rhizoctonia solani TaxID=456999 RepID=A0A8H2XVC7_9AGAM|nr:unnamed protein product [Rhizoctonia solani]